MCYDESVIRDSLDINKDKRPRVRNNYKNINSRRKKLLEYIEHKKTVEQSSLYLVVESLYDASSKESLIQRVKRDLIFLIEQGFISENKLKNSSGVEIKRSSYTFIKKLEEENGL